VPRAGLTVERLTVAGAELADEVGFEAVTLSALARRFDVRVASLYSHLESSAELRSRIAVLALTEMADLADRSLAGRAGLEAVRALGDAYRDYARLHPGRYAATKHPLERGVAGDAAGARHADLARAVLRAYDVTGPDETHAVRLLGSTIRGFVDLEAGGAFDRSEPSAEVSWARIPEALHAVLLGWSGRQYPA
jgi:AcrR family transcriptional regulator